MSLKKIKIITVVGTRPEIIRLSRIIARLNDSSVIDHKLVHTGQNYDYNLNEVFFDDLSIKSPDIYLDAAKNNPSETIGNILIKIDKIFEDLNPDAIFILGDTNSCLSSISAKKRKIPIFHFEAGNRCFDQRVPEEINRKIIDTISDINLTYSSLAKNYLVAEGLSPDRIINVGSPMYEVLNYYKDKILNSSILNKLNLKPKEFFLVSCHREENVDNPINFKLLFNCLNEVIEKYNLPVIFPIHPRTKKMLDLSKLTLNKQVFLIDPLPFSDYNNLQINSHTTLSDSGTIFEEASILNFRALNIRESHERPEAVEETSAIITGLNQERIIQGIKMLEKQKTGEKRNINIVSDYSKNNLSLKIERILLSYIDYINRVVWQKES